MRIMESLEKEMDLRQLRRWLPVLCAVSLILIPAGWLQGALGAGGPSAQSAGQSRRLTFRDENRPLASFQELLQNSPLFGFRQQRSALPVIQSSINELAQNYRLKGVALLGDPEAIVEDAVRQKTIFVKTGDSLGDLKVKTIEEGKIVLEYLGEEKVMTIDA